MNTFKAIAAAAFIVAAAQAQAISVSISNTPMSPVAGALTDTFDGNGTTVLSTSGGSFFSASISGITAQPPGSTGQWWSIGTSGGQDGPGIVTLGASATYYGFLWGSPDTYNHVSFFNDGELVQSFGGGDVFSPANGYQGAFPAGQFVGFTAQGAEVFDEVRFISNGNAFETDNHAVMLSAPIPEPETYALMLAGLGAVGFMARRRRAVSV